jgi:hypothetical protein
MLLIASLATLLVPVIASAMFDDGDWLCTACGLQTRRLSWLRSFSCSIALPGVAEPDAEFYATAFPETIRSRHRHEWTPVGGHRVGVLGTSCGKGDPSELWFSRLPRLRDHELATALALKLCGSPDAIRHEALSSYARCVYAASDDEQALGTWRERWRRDHPDWP